MNLEDRIMDFQRSKSAPYFSFLYGGEDIAKLLEKAAVSVEESAEGFETVFLLPDGLEITQKVKEYPAFHATEWVLYFKNKSKQKSGLITQLFDCDISLPFGSDTPPQPGYVIPQGTAKISNPIGSNWARDEFCSKEQYIPCGQTCRYANTGGRSSQGIAPFFDVNHGEYGAICAVGWTGQWHAVFSRDDTDIRIQTGIENIGFRLLPGEEIRTSSIVLMTYENGQNNGHNQFRRLIKEQFSLIGQPGRPQEGPFSTMTWGQLPTDQMIDRMQQYKKNKFGFEYFWVDAAWYGAPTGYSPSEHVGDWALQTGNWAVNTKAHPDDMLEVAKAVRDNDMQFLLWIEPERVISSNPFPQAHPEWFFKMPDDLSENATWLLNLGNPEALAGTIALVSDFIEKFDLGCYRQDFNMDPLGYWQCNDESERVGINEIKHIMGLYQFWDALLERFPHLCIDNCASGGRRIDIETLRRSIPLWRSDYQCTWDCDSETAQTHNAGISWWIPYSGTGTGRILGDTYRIRSCYSSAMVTTYWGYEGWEVSEDQPLDWVRSSNREYKRARPYFSCDYYPLTLPPIDDSNWAASQYDRPAGSDGIVLAFRRPLSPCETARFTLGGVLPGHNYFFEDADTGEVTEISAEELLKNGFVVKLPEKRGSKLYFYTIK